jgi:hypothetical protein
MLQQDSAFYFSRPMTYFGSFQHLEVDEKDLEILEINECIPFVLDIDPKYATKQITGLYLHWFDS